MLKPYKTLRGESFAEYEEKRSRFLATAVPVENEAEAMAVVQRLKTQYWDARHNCYAYALLENNGTSRSSDDGEPSGTAGVPILETLNRQGLSNVIVVVTRYFGGVLLGASGLIRAYGKAAGMALDAAGKLQVRACKAMVITMPYNLLGKVQNLLVEDGIMPGQANYTEDVQLICYPEVTVYDDLQARLIDKTGARVSILPGGMFRASFDEKNTIVDLIEDPER